MKVKELLRCRKGTEMARLLDNEPGVTCLRQSGSHRIYDIGEGRPRVIVPVHNSDMARGTLKAIVKALLVLAGVLAVAVIVF